MEDKDLTAKTAEEIFDNTFDFKNVDFEGCVRIDASDLKEEIISAMEEYAQQFKPSGERPDFESISESFADSMVFPDAKNHPIGSRDRSMWETVKEASKRGLVYAYCELSSPSKAESEEKKEPSIKEMFENIVNEKGTCVSCDQEKETHELCLQCASELSSSREQVLQEEIEILVNYLKDIVNSERKHPYELKLIAEKALSSYNKTT
jgi:hypothetical protein